MKFDFQYLTSFGVSECGPYREHNEDAYLLLPEAGCFFVADGVGGHESGEVASGMLVDRLKQEMGQLRDLSPTERVQKVSEVVEEVNRTLYERSQRNGLARGMGTTLVGLVFDNVESDLVHICHVGDSRAYLFRSGIVEQQTRDHASTVHKHAITRAIGPKASVELEWNELHLRAEDCLILCSDGISDVLAPEDLAGIIVQGGKDCQKIVQEMIVEAIARESHDNVTVIAVYLADVLPVSSSSSEENEGDTTQLS